MPDSQSVEEDEDAIVTSLNVVLGKKLEELRGFDRSTEKKKRGKKIHVEPGKSYTQVSSEDDDQVDLDDVPLSRRALKKPARKLPVKRKATFLDSGTDSDDDDPAIDIDNFLNMLVSDEDEAEHEPEPDDLPEPAREDPDDPVLTEPESDTPMPVPVPEEKNKKIRSLEVPATFNVGDWVAAVYEGQWFICQVKTVYA